MTWTLEQRRAQSDGLIKLLAIVLALVASLFAIGTAIYVSFDSYPIVLRQVALLVVPWAAVAAVFRRAYKTVAVCFALTTAIAYWIADTVWGILIVGTFLVVGILIHDRSQGT